MSTLSSDQTTTATTLQRACKHYHFGQGKGTIAIKVLELMDPDFGLYVWPSSLVLAEYIYQRLDLFTGTLQHPKIVLELGAGTALPTLLLAKAATLSTNQANTKIIATDRPDIPQILDNVRDALKENGIQSLYPQDPLSPVMVRGLGWGDFTFATTDNPDGGLLQLLKDVDAMASGPRGTRGGGGKVDIIVGSDTFYNPPDFESLLATVSYIIRRHNPTCVFLTTYQDRSAKRNIDHLLLKWGLEARVIEWEDFGFDMRKYVAEGYGSEGEESDMEDDDHDDDDDEEEDVEHSLEGDPSSDLNMEEEDKQWLELARQEVAMAAGTGMAATTAVRPGNGRLPLVNYSSGSDSDDDREDVVKVSTEEGIGEEEASQRGHLLGDGGALSSVHLLWICKHGEAEGAFDLWRSGLK